MFYDPVLPFSSFFWRRGAGRSKKHNIKASCNFHFSDFSEHPWPLPTCKSCGTMPFNVLEEKVPSSKIMSTWAPTSSHTCGAVEKQGAEDPRIETWWNMHASTKTLTKRFDSNPHFVDPLAVPSQQSIVHSRWMKKRWGKWPWRRQGWGWPWRRWCWWCKQSKPSIRQPIQRKERNKGPTKAGQACQESTYCRPRVSWRLMMRCTYCLLQALNQS